MSTWKLLLVIWSLAVGAANCRDLDVPDEKPEIVCMVNIYPEISEAILEKLEVCDHIIICYDGLCDLARKLRNFSDAKRVALLRSRAPDAKILRQVEVHFGENFDPDHAVHKVVASMAGGIFDGVELAFDSAHLDQQEQIKYAQFLKLLKRKLDRHLLISNSFVCKQQLPAFLANAMSEVLDYVILVPSSRNASAEGGGVLVPRVYSDSVANCLLNANFPRSKIVLGLPTGGQLVDPSADRESPSSMIPYGNVCELQEEQQRHCEELQNQNCSLFGEGVRLIYDDPNSAGGRALQCVGCRLRGISIVLSYDDSAGICLGSSFPLLAAIQNVFEHRSGVVGFQGCPTECEESEEDCESEHDADPPCQSDSEEEDDCCSDHGKSCNGCKLLNRLQGAVKTSEHVVGLSKSIADKVLESLDKVVALVSYMFGQQQVPVEPQSALIASSPVDLLNLSVPSELTLGLGQQNPMLPPAPSPVQTGLVPAVLNTVNQAVQTVLGSPATSPIASGPALPPSPVAPGVNLSVPLPSIANVTAAVQNVVDSLLNPLLPPAPLPPQLPPVNPPALVISPLGKRSIAVGQSGRKRIGIV